MLAWRVRLIRAVFTGGVEAAGTSQHVTATRGSKTPLDFTYTHAGREHFGGHTINDMRHSNKLQPGDNVTLLVDPTRPRVSFIRDLFQL